MTTNKSSGRHAQNKGKRYERKIANLYKSLGYDCRRGYQRREGDDEPDVQGLPFWVECKHYKKCGLAFRAFDQAKKATDGRPIVCHLHEDGGEDLVVIDMGLWLEMLKKWQGI